MLQNNKPSKDTKKSKKPLLKKLIIYLILILILIIMVAIGYFKFNKYLAMPVTILSNSTPAFNNIANKENLDNKELLKEGALQGESINTNILQEQLQKQIEFQKEIDQRVLDLEKKLKSNSNSEEKILFLSKISSLEQQINLLSNKKDYVKNFTIIYNLILALKSNLPFIIELDSFKRTSLSQNFSEEVKALEDIANKGIPNNYNLAYDFDALFPKIKTCIYQLDKSTWGKIKYYISYIFIIQKEDNFAIGDKSIDSIVYDIKAALLNNLPEKALAILVSNNLQNLKALESWYIKLNYRVQANILASKLQQYLLSTTSGK